MNKDFEATIGNAEEQLRQAMLGSNVKALDKLLSKDLVFTNHLGQCLGKEADLSAHKTGSITISKIDMSEQRIKRISENVAIVSVRVQISGTYAGQPTEGDFRFTRVWALSANSHWQVVSAHAGTVA